MLHSEKKSSVLVTLKNPLHASMLRPKNGVYVEESFMLIIERPEPHLNPRIRGLNLRNFLLDVFKLYIYRSTLQENHAFTTNVFMTA